MTCVIIIKSACKKVFVCGNLFIFIIKNKHKFVSLLFEGDLL